MIVVLVLQGPTYTKVKKQQQFRTGGQAITQCVPHWTYAIPEVDAAGAS
jgi:hypothetical protein